MPNDTDLTVFKGAGFAGLNFAYIVGVDHYHNALDNLANLDQRTLQHQGSTALALTRHFGNLKLNSSGSENEVYFDVLNASVVSYSERWAVPLAVVVCLSFVALVVFGFKNGHLTGYGLLVGFMVVPLSVVSTVVILTLTKDLLRINNYDLVLFTVITIGVLLVVNAKFARVGISNLMLGGYLWSLILLVLTALFLKGGSYLFTWPLLFNLGALGFVLVRKRPAILGLKELALLVAGAVPGIILFTPLVYLTSAALTLSSLTASIAIAVAAVLLLGPLTPHFAALAGFRKART
jgi:hypothetical protein